MEIPFLIRIMACDEHPGQILWFLSIKPRPLLKRLPYQQSCLARSLPLLRVCMLHLFQVLEVKVDASNLPRKYSQVVYTQCFNFPQKLIFFLLTTFKVS
jgi:hypothetical protein